MSPPRILLADDDDSHQELIEASILDHCPQAEVMRVRTGTQFMDAARSRSFDCLVLDFNLADARADELLTRLASRGSTAPVVVVSSAEEQDVVVRCIRSGGADFVPKSEAIAGSVLWERIQAAIDNRRRQAREHRQMRRRVRRLARLAETDPLTGLLNRFGLRRHLDGRRRLLDRRGEVSMVVMDVDRFKRINDTHGHLCGDRVLARVGDVIRDCCGSDFIACRWGGEEFITLLPDTRLGAAWVWAERLRQALAAEPVEWQGAGVPVTVSIGLVQYAPGERWDRAVQRADDALLLAKQRGRNQVCSWAMVLLERLAAEGSLRRVTDGRERLQRLVEYTRKHLGPTQENHLLQHGRAVADLAFRLATRLKLDPPSARQLHEAGLFHDLGKFFVPEDILAKPGPLSAEERSCLRRQAACAADLGERAGWLTPGVAAEAVRNHHLRFDDAGGRLSAGAGIVGLADTYDAMISHRAYRPARTPAEALVELDGERGRRLAPDAADAAVRILA